METFSRTILVSQLGSMLLTEVRAVQSYVVDAHWRKKKKMHVDTQHPLTLPKITAHS